MSLSIKSATDYPAPRESPLSYPGRRPRWSFLLLRGGQVHPVDLPPNPLPKSSQLGLCGVMADSGQQLALDGFLSELGVATMERRFLVIAYGSNSVPGQLTSKFGQDCVVPVIKGHAQGCDVVYNLISNRGYAFAELYIDGAASACADVSITFLDDHQLQIMVETEENYILAYSPRDVRLENGQYLSAERVNNFETLW